MKRFLKVLAGLFVLLLLTVLASAWWYLDSEEMQAPELAGTTVPGDLQHQDHSRTWRAYIPDALARPAPIVLVMHGSRGSGEQMLAATRYSFNVLAEQRGFIAVYPDGYEQHWNDCRGGANYSANTQDIDDVGFLRALVAQLATEHEVDLSRIYATGLSNGGHMAYRLGLEAPEFIAGIAAVAANLPVAENLDCVPSGQPVATLVMNGTEDPINPYGGGVVEIGGDASRGMVLSTTATGGYWADSAGFEGEGQTLQWPDQNASDGTTVETVRWLEPGKEPVEVISILGGGHTWPNPEFRLPRILGRTSHEFDAADVIWAFFAGEEYGPGQ